MSFLLKVLREGLGRLIVFIDWVSRSRAVKRTSEAQAIVDSQTKGLALYQFYACPFCTRTRRAIYKLNLSIETRDIRKHTHYREELEANGGKVKVPCLRIEEAGNVRWLYESKDIIRYLNERFGEESIEVAA